MSDFENIESHLGELDQMVRVIQGLGPPKLVVTPEFGMTADRCAECRNVVQLSEFAILKSSLMSVVDNLCSRCRPHHKASAIIACARCKKALGRMPPHVDKSGFRFEKDIIYHTDCCATCETEIVTVHQQPTFILEMLFYFRKKGIPVPDDWKKRNYKKPLILGVS